ncbi:MAG TPA: hypothetical protein PK886_01400 [Candidatus Paceibacterota bacterium]|nr:hypothetical protein [Candidatus Paceibacterota bacterium]
MNFKKDNLNTKEKFWFVRKTYGWGWVPATWQGWLVLFIYIIILTLFSFTVDEYSSFREIIFTFILPVLFLTITLIRICYKKGEKPRWQWGTRKE